ncbi:hypothetical protein BKA70DRAFT_452100 [Coprinopsis sp. MPI-PUGE-AT-0042]|nr:hypothetical protein BKA70DRAFT_452100 [Coprinopsis sp. MPI-PUGE-AT-0042]
MFEIPACNLHKYILDTVSCSQTSRSVMIIWFPFRSDCGARQRQQCHASAFRSLRQPIVPDSRPHHRQPTTATTTTTISTSRRHWTPKEKARDDPTMHSKLQSHRADHWTTRGLSRHNVPAPMSTSTRFLHPYQPRIIPMTGLAAVRSQLHLHASMNRLLYLRRHLPGDIAGTRNDQQRIQLAASSHRYLCYSTRTARTDTSRKFHAKRRRIAVMRWDLAESESEGTPAFHQFKSDRLTKLYRASLRPSAPPYKVLRRYVATCADNDTIDSTSLTKRRPPGCRNTDATHGSHHALSL